MATKKTTKKAATKNVKAQFGPGSKGVKTTATKKTAKKTAPKKAAAKTKKIKTLLSPSTKGVSN